MIVLVVFGFLYATGLHTPVIGQVQRLILATGLMNPSVPETIQPEAAHRSDAATYSPGYQFTMTTLDGKTVTLESLRGKGSISESVGYLVSPLPGGDARYREAVSVHG